MSTQGRLVLTALGFCARLPAAQRGAAVLDPGAAARYVPLAGALIGALGAAVYWLGAQLWPTSIAVVLMLAATEAATRPVPVRGVATVGFVFALRLKYNTLMALSAASLAFALPAYLALGLITIAGHAASRALVVSLIAASGADSSTRISGTDLVFALGLGFAPAILLGLPGLVGLACALLARVAFGAYLKSRRKSPARGALYAAQQLTEVCFYLAALASWGYV
ncbi:MAG: hypothetical protein NVS1B6_01080 [Steroidobacteraceae bacterium]